MLALDSAAIALVLSLAALVVGGGSWLAYLAGRHRRRGLLGLRPQAVAAAIERQLPDELLSHLGPEGVATAAEWVIRILVSRSAGGNGHGRHPADGSASFVVGAPEVVEEMVERSQDEGLGLTAWEANAIFEAVLGHLRRRKMI